MDPESKDRLRSQYEEVEHDFLRRNKDRCGRYSQYRKVFETLIPRIRNACFEENIDEWAFEEKLRKMEELIDDIAYALKAFRRDPPRDTLGFYGVNSLIERPDDWLIDESPIDQNSLDQATAMYLNNSLLQMNIIDWHILNGFIFDEMARLAESIKSGQAVGRINWAYLLSGGNVAKAYFWRLGLALITFLLRWVAVPLIAYILYQMGHQRILPWILVPYGIYLLIYLVFLPLRFIRNRSKRKNISSLQEKLEKMMKVYSSSSSATLNPTQLRSQINKLEEDGIHFAPAVYSILDRAIQRDPAVFSTESLAN